MTGKLKQLAISGMLWSAVERFGSSVFMFIANLILARLLMPEDFGVVAMLMVFISISETIVNAGFCTALIQKKDIENIDCSTIFVWNTSFSVFLYIILFVLSPYISDFYNMEILKDVLRVQSIVIPVNSLSLVQLALFQKDLEFKIIAKNNLSSMLIGTFMGIVFAFLGYGVWSLVIKQVTTSFVQTALYLYSGKWKIGFTFSYSHFKSMFSFAGFVLLNRLVNTLYHNVLAMIIGKSYNASSLGCYNQARKLEDLPRSTISSIVNSVVFPLFSKVNNNIEKQQYAMSKGLRALSFVSIPVLFLLMIVAQPLIILLFTEKWIDAVPYFQILCVGGMFITPLEINTELLNSKGCSKLTFNIRLFQLIFGLVIMLLTYQLGLYVLLWSYVISQLLSYLISAYYTGKYINYGLIKQMIDMLPFIVTSIVCSLFTLVILQFIDALSIQIQLIISFFAFAASYVMIVFVLQFEERKLFGIIIKNAIKR